MTAGAAVAAEVAATGGSAGRGSCGQEGLRAGGAAGRRVTEVGGAADAGASGSRSFRRQDPRTAVAAGSRSSYVVHNHITLTNKEPCYM